MENLWRYLITNHSSIIFSYFFPDLIVAVFFLVVVSFYMFIDINNYFPKSKFVLKPFSSDDLRKEIWVIFKNYFFLAIPMVTFYFIKTILAQVSFGNMVFPDHVPSLSTFVFHILFCFVGFEVCFFIIHFSFHKFDFLYHYIHATHHEFNQTNALLSHYIHWSEFLIVAFLTIIFPIICNAHPLTYWCWIVINTFLSIQVHCGYEFIDSNFVPFGLYSGPKGYFHTNNSKVMIIIILIQRKIFNLISRIWTRYLGLTKNIKRMKKGFKNIFLLNIIK
jgi:sterol desaturase/sphingolipid hydroxylase (fatty acid hydroxylase superfamily)